MEFETNLLDIGLCLTGAYCLFKLYYEYEVSKYLLNKAEVKMTHLNDYTILKRECLEYTNDYHHYEIIDKKKHRIIGKVLIEKVFNTYTIEELSLENMLIDERDLFFNFIEDDLKKRKAKKLFAKPNYSGELALTAHGFKINNKERSIRTKDYFGIKMYKNLI